MEIKTVTNSIGIFGISGEGIERSAELLNLQNKEVTDLELPGWVECEGTWYPLTALGEHCCGEAERLRSLTVPASVNMVRGEALVGANALSMVKFLCPDPVPVEPVHSSSFTIVYSTFVKLFVPAGSRAKYRRCPLWRTSSFVSEFGSCEGRQEVCVDGLRYVLRSGGEAMLAAQYTDLEGDVAVPGHITVGGRRHAVTSAEEACFMSCDRVTSVTLPDTLRALAPHFAFNMPALRRLRLPSGLTELPDSCLCRTALSHVDLPEGLERLGGFCLFDTERLERIALPMGLRKIGDECFDGCASLQAVSLPRSVEVLGDDCFRNCKGLRALICRWDDPAEELQTSDHIVDFETLPPSMVLFVPRGTRSRYAASYVFGGFPRVEEYDLYDDPAAGEDALLDAATAYVEREHAAMEAEADAIASMALHVVHDPAIAAVPALYNHWGRRYANLAAFVGNKVPADDRDAKHFCLDMLVDLLWNPLYRSLLRRGTPREATAALLAMAPKLGSHRLNLTLLEQILTDVRGAMGPYHFGIAPATADITVGGTTYHGIHDLLAQADRKDSPLCDVWQFFPRFDEFDECDMRCFHNIFFFPPDSPLRDVARQWKPKARGFEESMLTEDMPAELLPAVYFKDEDDVVYVAWP
jgi:hypothetical protein